MAIINNNNNNNEIIKDNNSNKSKVWEKIKKDTSIKNQKNWNFDSSCFT